MIYGIIVFQKEPIFPDSEKGIKKDYPGYDLTDNRR